MFTSRNSKNFPSITKHPKHLMSSSLKMRMTRVLWRLLAFLVLNKPPINDQNAGRLSIQLIPNFKHSCNLQITKSSSCSWISSESLHNFNRFFLLLSLFGESFRDNPKNLLWNKQKTVSRSPDFVILWDFCWRVWPIPLAHYIIKMAIVAHKCLKVGDIVFPSLLGGNKVDLPWLNVLMIHDNFIEMVDSV